MQMIIEEYGSTIIQMFAAMAYLVFVSTFLQTIVSTIIKIYIYNIVGI